ncbi:TPA: hypothetical protein HA344_05290 [Candidatus Bathyarchaeota archaeon]|nr:hypothetical protein [Candidatus Bathyarchaeota archaeon]
MNDTRVPTGVTNLDASLEGGIPRGNTFIIAGNAGTGKTLLASNSSTTAPLSANSAYTSHSPRAGLLSSTICRRQAGTSTTQTYPEPWM